MAPSTLASICLAAGALVLAGCPSSKTGLPIEHVEVFDRAGIGVDRNLAVDKARIQKVAVAAIEKIGTHSVRKAKSDEVGWQLTIEVQLTTERSARATDAGVIPKDQVYRAAGVTMRLFALGSKVPEGFRPRYESQALIGRNAPMLEEFGALTDEALRAAASDVALEIELSRMKDDDVIGMLGNVSGHKRTLTVAEIGRRQLPKAVPVLIEILESDEKDSEVLIETIGALIASKDPRAVGPLIDSARRRSPIYLNQIIFGVAAIGGKQAEAYLFTVASGHPDPNVKRNAKDALQELERRKRVAPKEKKTDG